VTPPSDGYTGAMGKLTGRITEFLGQWTNDRETEAKGRAEQKTPEPGEKAVEREKEQVRRDHGDVSD
jgi:uncharacterized protein YjbJ (UPF0337 family)